MRVDTPVPTHRFSQFMHLVNQFLPNSMLHFPISSYILFHKLDRKRFSYSCRVQIRSELLHMDYDCTVREHHTGPTARRLCHSSYVGVLTWFLLIIAYVRCYLRCCLEFCNRTFTGSVKRLKILGNQSQWWNMQRDHKTVARRSFACLCLHAFYS